MVSKIRSRKLWVWIVYTGLLISSFVLTHTISPELVNGYSIVTALYIGGNVAQKFLYKKED